MSKFKFLKKFHFFKKKKVYLPILLVGIIAYVFCLPYPLFKAPVCKVLFDREEQLLGASIANDGQWRFPLNSNVPKKFEECIIEFEDRRFRSHPGFDIIGIGRAIKQNFSNKKIVSGASTLSMQVIRLSRPGKSRSILRKMIEMIQATRLEISYSKDEILAYYSSNAPFGGNVVGLHAASLRYYGKNPSLLSWGEAATLAVLPNSPSLIHPGKNRDLLLAKRNRLLQRLFDQNIIDATSLELAMEEELPDKPLPLPRVAPHLLHTAFSKQETNRKAALYSSLDLELQKSVNQILSSYKNELNAKGINNACVMVVDNSEKKVLAYVGNMPDAGTQHHGDVDIIPARRSTGSILKPILSMLVLDEGLYLPESILPDVPTHLSGYNPENYKNTYDGVIPLSQALQRSLNIPFVRALQSYGLEKFHHQLKRLGFTHIDESAKHYGLSLILGGAEVSLWDLCKVYSGASLTLSHFTENDAQYFSRDFDDLSFDLADVPSSIQKENDAPFIGAAAIWHSFESMKKVERPNSEGDWKSFKSAQKIAWKTGTSFGFRDAWSIGLTRDYLVGVWVGNADGEGKPGLIGVEMAAPILFDVFRSLPKSEWFDKPYDDMQELAICTKSGYRAKEGVCEIDSSYVPVNGSESKLCPHHKLIFLDEEKELQVNDACRNPLKIRKTPWFVLNPVEEFYYKKSNPSYREIPPFDPACLSANENGIEASMQFIYPRIVNKIYVPIGLDGEVGKTVFKIAHRKEEETIHWHLNNSYLGSTKHFHQMELNPGFGYHTITLVDEQGASLSKNFEILSK